MKNKFFTSLNLIAVVLFSSLLFTQAKAQCQANWNFTANGCTVAFANTSTGTNNNTYYYWSFGDGQTSTQQSPPSHTYAASGTYWVCLSLYSSDSSCTSQLCKYITVQCGTTGNCVANFQWYPDSSNSCMIYFYNTSTGSNNPSYSWYFPGGSPSSSNMQNPNAITYAASGTYNVCLYMYSNGQWCDSVCKWITVQCGGGGTGIASFSQSDLSLSVTNPVVWSTDIQYFIPSSGSVKLSLFDVVGNKIGVLETGNRSAGMHAYSLSTVGFSKGIYFIHLNFEGATITKKIIIVE